MTDHEKFKALLKKAGLSYNDLAIELGFTYNSVKSMLAPGKELPKWAKSMLILDERLNNGLSPSLFLNNKWLYLV